MFRTLQRNVPSALSRFSVTDVLTAEHAKAGIERLYAFDKPSDDDLFLID